MLDKDTLLKIRTFVSDEQIEKDYLQYIILKSFYEKGADRLIFKGGTALQKAYGLDRYSEDIDFTMNGDAIREFDSGMQNLKNYCDILNNVEDDRIVNGNVINFSVMLRGPVSPRIVEIDIVNEPTLLKPLVKPIRSPYGDPPPFPANVMNEREILAEKIRAMMNRKLKKERDLYDIYFILKNGVEFDMGLIASKLKTIDKKFSFKEFKEKVEGFRDSWKNLRIFVNDLPEYEVVSSYVLGRFNTLIFV